MFGACHTALVEKQTHSGLAFTLFKIKDLVISSILKWGCLLLTEKR